MISIAVELTDKIVDILRNKKASKIEHVYLLGEGVDIDDI